MAKKKTGRSRTLRDEIAELKQRLAEAEQNLDAIRTGAVDALVIKGPHGDQIFTLKDADRPYRAVLENMRDGAVTLREDGLVLYANKQFAAMLDRPLETVLGASLFELAGPGGRSNLQKIVDEAGQSDAHGEVEFARDEGPPAVVRVSLKSMTIEGLRVLAGVVYDVSEERKAQLKIRQLERTEGLGRMAGGVAHDLNNILQPIIVNAELLYEEAESGSRERAMLANIIEAANRQRGLVKRILSFTRQLKPTRGPVAATPLVLEALNLIKPSLPGGIEVRLVTDAVNDTINGDATEFHELVSNLCTNAADAMAQTGGTLEISLHDINLAQENLKLELKPGRYLKLAVRDSGTGISPRDLEHIFDPFFTTKETGKGTGIGLSVVKGIVQSYGGSIEVQSQVGRGTEVAVFLPALSSPQFEAPIPTRGWGRGLAGRRILVVDDEEMVLDTIGRALMSFGHSPTTLTDPSAALSLFRSLPKHFDLAIIDQTMPRMTGVELAAEIRKINPDVPILIATGYSRALDDRSLQAAGMTAVIMKPLSLRDFQIAVDSALQSRTRKR